MRTSARLSLAALMAAVLLSATVGTASARNLSVTEQSFRASWASLEFVTSVVTVRCRVTFEGSFHSRTIVKVARSLVGAVTRAIIAHPCTNGEAWVDNGTEREPLGTAPNRLPFHLTYESFTGTLPAITNIGGLITRGSFVIRATVLGLACQGRYGRPEDNRSGTVNREAGGGLTSITNRAGNRISLVEQLGTNAVCPAEGSFAGTSGPVTGLTDGRVITLTLI